MGIISRSLAALMLIIFSPIFLLISAGSLLFQGFPILFKQERVGFKYNLFKLYKFRTMKVNNDNKSVTETGDRRVTTWGKILRMIKLDELPQLWNIITGDMRFVGPRPEVEHYVTKESFRFLNSVKPGLTDFSSILLRNEEQIIAHMGGVENYPELLKIKVKLGQLYTNQKGFKLDLILVIFTLMAIVAPFFAQKTIQTHFILRYDKALYVQIGNLKI